MLIRTHLLHKDSLSLLANLRVVSLALLAYSGICVLGGFIDVTRKPPVRPLKEEFNLRLAWQRTPRRTKIGTLLLGIGFAYWLLFGV